MNSDFLPQAAVYIPLAGVDSRMNSNFTRRNGAGMQRNQTGE